MQTRRLASLLIAVLAGCAPRTTPPVAKSTAAPAATASTAPKAKLTREVLKAPAGGSTRVQGTLVVDAGYLVKAGVGQVISNDGNSAVYPAAALIGNDGASVVAQGAGNLIASDGGSIISSDGASLIGNDGASAVAKQRHVLATGGLDDRVAAGFAIRAIGLRDNKAVPLGVDGAGKPVYVVLTDAKGGYDLHLPDKLAGGVRLVASPPGATDRRATYNLLVGTEGEQGGKFTEAASGWTTYVRHLMLAVLRPAVSHQDGGKDDANAFSELAGGGELVRGQIDKAFKACEEEGIGELDATRREFVLQRFVDAVLDRAQLEGVGVGNTEGYKGDGNELARSAFEDILGKIRAGAAAALAKDPDYFGKRPYVIAANARRHAAGKPIFEFKKASDVGDFIVDEYFGSGTDAPHQHMAGEVLIDVGVPPEQVFRLLSANTAVGIGLLGAFLSGFDGEIEATLRAAVREQKGPNRPQVPSPGPLVAPVLLPPPPTAEGYTVSALAGTKNTGPWHMAIGPDGNLYYVDVVNSVVKRVDLHGPERPITVAAAVPPGSKGLAFDPSAAEPTLYVGSYASGAITRVLPGPMEELKLTGTFTPGKMSQMAITKDHGLIVAQDHPAAVLRIELEGEHKVTVLAGDLPEFILGLPAGLALAPDDTIYVADAATQAVVRIQDGVHVVAGRGYAGPTDGYYDDAKFANPQGLAFAPDGSLVVADTTSKAVRRVRLFQGGGVVTTLTSADAGLANLTGVAVAPSGEIFVGENENTQIRVLTPR